MKRQLVLVALAFGATSFLYGAEISAFDAGNLNSASPYGLTKNEELLLQQTQKVETLSKDLSSVRLELNRLKEQTEGVRSVLDGTASKVGRSDQEVRGLEQKVTQLEEALSDLSEKVTEVETTAQENRATQEANNERIKVVLGELSSLIDSINTNYASKESVSALIERLEAVENQAATTEVDTTALAQKPGAELIDEALKHFNAGELDEAQARYELLVTKNYMPARSNYFLGEIAYQKEHWKTAIKHYKISIDLYDKADYIPRLLYHTAISFDKIGEPENATPFYNALKSNYPDSKEAKAAPSR